jgi:antitoxin component YwqK of YwqJK toxin-antitoxin module
MKSILLLSSLLISCIGYSQIDLESQIPKDKKYDNSIIDGIYGIQLYEPLNMTLEGDSVRMENGYAVSNWKEDFYEDGSLLHRGFYIDGQLKVYKNFYPNGQIEREFKNIDGYRSLQKKFYAD